MNHTTYLKKDIENQLNEIKSLSFLKNYTPFYIKKYLEFHRKADIYKYKCNYISKTEWVITKNEN